MRGTFQQYRPVWSSRPQLHHACKSLSLTPPRRAILLVRAKAYQVTVQFPKEVVRSDRCSRGDPLHGKKYDFIKLYVQGRTLTLPRFLYSDQKRMEKFFTYRILLKIGLNLHYSTKGDLCRDSDDFKFSIL
jgi:hypothetical protein